MPKLSALLATAGAVLSVACSDAVSPSTAPQFSKQITFTNLQTVVGQLPVGGAARVEIELPSIGLIAREVKVKDPQEVNQPEGVESRITAIVVTTAGDQGTLTLEPGFKVDFTKDTKFEAAGANVTLQQFVDRVNAALNASPTVFLPVEAQRSPVNPSTLGPGDAFPASQLDLRDEVGGPEVQINIASANLLAIGSDCPTSLSPTLKGCVKVLGLVIGIDATTELEAMLPGMVETKFDGVVDCKAVEVTSAHEGSFSLVGQPTTILITAATQIEFEAGDGEKLADLNALKAACDQNQVVLADGEGVAGMTAGTLEATEVKFELEQQVQAAEVEFNGTIEAIQPPDHLTVSGRAVITTAATEIERADAPSTFGDLKQGDPVKVEGTLQSDGSVLARRIRVELNS